ncbi:MAG: FtsB family cell division protein [Bacteroidales bacterium]|jgi:cell division protein FtsB|nr:septum formation initiator family protein [Bacteroidales bacterium]
MKYIPSFLKNKYFITIFVFVVYISFFDSNNLLRQKDLLQELKKVEKERQYYLQEIKENQTTTYELLNNIDLLEKYAREKYLMKRDDEDIFLIIRPNENNVTE